MKTYNNSVTLRNDGIDSSTSEKDLNAAVGVNVTIRAASTPIAGQGALASIFNIAEDAIANPLQTDNQGNYTFKAPDGLYDIVIAEGTPDETILSSVEIVELITPDFINNLSLPYVFDTVADMVASTIAFPDGKVLKVKNINTSYTVISGGTIYPNVSPALTGGGYAAFVSADSSISYTQAGAALDGVTNDDTIIQEVNIFAKNNNLEVRQSGGTALLSGGTAINFTGVDCYFSNDFRFKLNVDPAGDVLVFSPEYTVTTLDQSGITIGDFVKSATEIPSLSTYNQQYCVIKSTETNLIRVGGQVQTKGDVTVLGDNGELAYPLTTTYGSISSIELSPINVKTVTIKGFTLETVGSVDAAYPIKVTRNNVKFVSPRYINSNKSTSIAVQQLFTLTNCYNTMFENPICDSLSDGQVDFNYVITGAYYCKLHVSGMTSFEGWAQIDGNYTRDVKIIDSTIDRAGGHFHCFDYTFENITCNRVNPIDLSGGGLLSVSNIKININDDYIDSGIPATVVTRADYGCEWDGQIEIDGIYIDARGVKTLAADKTFYVLNGAIDSSATGHNFGRDLILPQYVNIDDVVLRSPEGLTEKLSLQSARLGVGATPAGAISVKYPERVQVSNVNVDNTNSGSYNANMSVYLIGSGQQAVANSKCDIIVDKCNNDDPRDFNLNPYDAGQIASIYTEEITNLTINSKSINCDWERLDIRGINRHDKYRGRVAAISGTGTVNQWDVVQSATSMSGTWRGAWFGGVIEAYFATDNTYKQVGFPNEIEDNLTLAKNVQTEVNGAIKTLTLTIAELDTGYKDAVFYQ